MYDNNLYKNLNEKYGKLALTVDECAAELGVSASDINTGIENGDLNVIRLGKRVLVPIPSFIEFIFKDNLANTTANPIDINSTSTVESTKIEIVEDENMSKGSVSFVTSSNLWVYQIDLGKTDNGKRIRKSKSFKSEKEAREALEIQLSIIQGNNKKEIINSNAESVATITLKNLIEAYLKLDNRDATSRSMDSYYTVGRIISSAYGKCKVSELTSEHFIHLFKDLKKKYSESILLKAYLFAKIIMDYAVQKKFIETNPMTVVKKPKSEKVKAEQYKAFTPEELSEIITAARNYPEIYPILLVLQNTGMRPGELRALKWTNLNTKNKTIFIVNAATYKTERNGLDSKPIKTEFIGPTKSAYSVRTLSLSDSVLDSLKVWREYLKTNKKYKHAVNSEFIFPNVNGGFIKDDALRKMFRKFLKNSGLNNKGFHLYRFRHSMCTNLVMQNTPIPVIQRIMGDNTTDVIFKIYTSVNSKDVKDATLKVQQHFDEINSGKHDGK